MIHFTYTILPLVKFLTIFMLVYIVIPYYILRNFLSGKAILEKILFSLCMSHFVLITLVFILSFFKIYETVSLYVSLILIITAAKFYEKKYTKNNKPSFIYYIFVLCEDRKACILNNIKKLKTKLLDIKKLLYNNLFLKIFKSPISIFFLVILIIGAYIRFKHSITHFYFASSDAYVHLTWSKYIGFNNVFADGVYPMGFEATISVLNKLFGFDVYYIVRFMGPLTGMIIMFTIFMTVYYISGKKNFLAAVLSIMMYVVFANPIIIDEAIPVNVWRQISSLSMEYSIIFLLPGLYFLKRYLYTVDRKYIVAYSICLILSAYIHTYTFFILIISIGVMSIINMNFIIKNYKQAIIFYLNSIIFSVIGFLPIIIGLLLGKEFHKSTIDYSIGNNRFDGYVFNLNKLLDFDEPSKFLFVYLILAMVIFIIHIIIYIVALREKTEKYYIKYNITNCIIVFLLYVMYRAEYLGLPQVMDSYRAGTYLAIFMVINIAQIFNIIDVVFDEKYVQLRVKYIIFVLFFGLSILFSDYSIWDSKVIIKTPIADKFEYDEAALSYLKIKNKYKFKDWIIIAPTEQYQQVLGNGFHKELWRFMKDSTDSTDNDEPYYIKNENIFVFIEKRLLNDNKTVSWDHALKDVPVIENGNLDEYYKDPYLRMIIESKAYFWARTLRTKTDYLDVFYETDKFIVYQIKQDLKKPIDLFKYIDENIDLYNEENN